jgi:excisionase family DNA binding protein
MEKLLKPTEAAELLNISRASLYIWIQKGIIRPVKLPTGKLRIPLSELERVIDEANPEVKFYFAPPGMISPERSNKGHEKSGES